MSRPRRRSSGGILTKWPNRVVNSCQMFWHIIFSTDTTAHPQVRLGNEYSSALNTRLSATWPPRGLVGAPKKQQNGHWSRTRSPEPREADTSWHKRGTCSIGTGEHLRRGFAQVRASYGERRPTSDACALEREVHAVWSMPHRRSLFAFCASGRICRSARAAHSLTRKVFIAVRRRPHAAVPRVLEPCSLPTAPNHHISTTRANQTAIRVLAYFYSPARLVPRLIRPTQIST